MDRPTCEHTLEWQMWGILNEIWYQHCNPHHTTLEGRAKQECRHPGEHTRRYKYMLQPQWLSNTEACHHKSMLRALGWSFKKPEKWLQCFKLMSRGTALAGPASVESTMRERPLTRSANVGMKLALLSQISGRRHLWETIWILGTVPCILLPAISYRELSIRTIDSHDVMCRISQSKPEKPRFHVFHESHMSWLNPANPA